jgi:gamma-polyglutamate synthase
MEVTLGLAVITLLLGLAGVFELRAHRKNLAKIPIRIHVNGTRGKSSVTRLIAAGLREHGVVTCAKTTGTTARMILPDASELPIFRPTGANIIEQKRIVRLAAAQDAQALVIECMALQPELQALSEFKLVQATHAVITNVRPDHLDVMGPSEQHVAQALAGMAPVRGRLYTAEVAQFELLRRAALDRGSQLVTVNEQDLERVTPQDLAGFSYTEHPDNVALALKVCEDLGVPRSVALRGMCKCRPDPGALTTYHVNFFGRNLVFMNAFAANDPVSTRKLWELAVAGAGPNDKRIAIFNCRADRPDRSLHLGAEFAHWSSADHVMLMGSGTYTFARAAVRAGLDGSKLVFVEELPVQEIFERIVSLSGSSATIMGMGNIGGNGLSLVRYFSNRARETEAA